MNTSDTGIRILSLSVSAESLTAQLSDGRTVSNPLKWYPRLLKASAAERKNFEISGNGYGVHWEKLDEDLSARGIAGGIPSIEFRALAREQV